MWERGSRLVFLLRQVLGGAGLSWGGLLPAPRTYQHDARDHRQETSDRPEILACHEATGNDTNPLKKPNHTCQGEQDTEYS